MIKFYESAPFVAVEYSYDVEKILYKSKSKYQDIAVIENPYFGRMLILDRVVQITERDEFFYHEMLSHVLLHSHPNPRNVVVIGGGDGGAVREVLKHKCVEKVWFIEIDREVIEVSKRFFPEVASGVDDPRVEVKCMDGAEFIKSRKGDIDVIMVDSTDPIGFARTLFSEEFYKAAYNALTEDGMYVTQSESISLHSDIIAEVQRTLKKVFPITDLYSVPLVTYPGNWWTFSVGSKKLDPKEMRRRFEAETKYYNDEIHSHCFMPRSIYGRLMSGGLGW